MDCRDSICEFPDSFPHLCLEAIKGWNSESNEFSHIRLCSTRLTDGNSFGICSITLKTKDHDNLRLFRSIEMNQPTWN